MMTAIERSHVAQGYRLPDSLSWGRVAELRRKWCVAQIFVPLAPARGCIGWAVRFIHGLPLGHC